MIFLWGKTILNKNSGANLPFCRTCLFRLLPPFRRRRRAGVCPLPCRRPEDPDGGAGRCRQALTEFQLRPDCLADRPWLEGRKALLERQSGLSRKAGRPYLEGSLKSCCRDGWRLTFGGGPPWCGGGAGRLWEGHGACGGGGRMAVCAVSGGRCLFCRQRLRDEGGRKAAAAADAWSGRCSLFVFQGCSPVCGFPSLSVASLSGGTGRRAVSVLVPFAWDGRQNGNIFFFFYSLCFS